MSVTLQLLSTSLIVSNLLIPNNNKYYYYYEITKNHRSGQWSVT